MALNITQEQYNTARAYANAGDYKNGWNYLQRYRTAVTEAGLPPDVAFDGVFTRSIGEALDWLDPGHKTLDWPDALGIEDARQTESHVFDDLSKAESWGTLIKDLVDTAAELANRGLNDIAVTWDTMVDDVKKAFIDFSLSDTINDIKNFFDTASTIPSPVILDLDGDGVETTAANAGTYFDHTGDGFAEQTGWVGKDDGLLVRDLNANDSIDSGAELFGSETRLTNGAKAANGFEALKELDGNNDGKIDTNDTAFTTLKIWKDANGDGHSSAAELLTLVDSGVQSINVGYTNSTLVDANSNQHQQVGSYTTTAGQTRAAEDIWFKTDTTYSIATDKLNVPADIAALPDAKGYGKVYDLHQAMVRDTSGSLKNLVTQFTEATTVADREVLLQSIIYKWAGVENFDPNSRAATMIYGNAIGDARKLEPLEEFMGEEWFGVWCWGTKDPNPHGHAAPVLLEAYAELSETIYGQLAAQSFLKPLYDKIDLTWDTATQTFKGDLSLVATDITAAINANHTAGKEMLGEFMRSLKAMGSLGMMDIVSFTTALSPLGLDVVSLVNSAWAVVGTNGNDTLAGGSDADMLQGLGGNDTLTGNAGNDILDGSNGNDTLYGNDGADVLYGGTGNDQLYGGAGVGQYYFYRGDGQDTLHEDYLDDTWINIGDLAFEELTFRRSGADLVMSFQTSTTDGIVLAEFFKNGEPQNALVLKKSNGDTQVLNAGALIQLTNDTLDGGDGADDIYGGTGNDTLAGGNDDDKFHGEAGNDILSGCAGGDLLEGGEGNDSLSGDAGVDLLDGGAGADNMAGSAGDDAYIVDDIGDSLVEVAGEGIDSVNSSISLTLSDNVDNLLLVGYAGINATGNAGANAMLGNTGANQLTGLGATTNCVATRVPTSWMAALVMIFLMAVQVQIR